VFGFQYSARCRTGFFQSMLLLKLLILAPANKPSRLACASARALMTGR
jgi:hypothetical protein